MGQVVKEESGRVTRRRVNGWLAVGWGALVVCGVTVMGMVLDFLAPKAGRERKRRWRVGKGEEFAGGGVFEQYKRTPDGEAGFWVVCGAEERRLVALSTVCTHLGCIPNWLAAEGKFKCPCHGSVFDAAGVNQEGPAPRPLERFGIAKDGEENVVVDMGRVYRKERGQWEDPGSFTGC